MSQNAADIKTERGGADSPELQLIINFVNEVAASAGVDTEQLPDGTAYGSWTRFTKYDNSALVVVCLPDDGIVIFAERLM
ncbi:MAG: hypothetical protein LBS90_05760 [Oscillospiraceae bacterium]|nr:hypothetical protein [Oscillospiraceae bacterium]